MCFGGHSSAQNVGKFEKHGAGQATASWDAAVGAVH